MNKPSLRSAPQTSRPFISTLFLSPPALILTSNHPIPYLPLVYKAHFTIQKGLWMVYGQPSARFQLFHVALPSAGIWLLQSNTG